MKKELLILILFFFIYTVAYCQQTDGYVVPAEIINGDTIPLLLLDEVFINPQKIIIDIKNKPKYSKLIRDVKKVYPYALIAQVKLKEYNDILLKVTSESEKKKIMKQAEEDIKKQFTEDIKSMTLTQGKILLKLIYRQTGETSYEIVKELRGSIRAVFWQTLARFFGASLKIEYDPAGVDKAIEEIVIQIENGKL